MLLKKSLLLFAGKGGLWLVLDHVSISGGHRIMVIGLTSATPSLLDLRR